KAGSLGQRDRVGNWLYGVACRTAARARVEAARRRAREGQVVSRTETPPDDAPLWRDLRPVLDAEVSRLPNKYRAALVLCYLEGKTTQEAAQELGCPVGTVLSRLAWARERLRDRLTRRGLTLSAGVLAAALSEQALAAPVPASLASTTVRNATLVA